MVGLQVLVKLLLLVVLLLLEIVRCDRTHTCGFNDGFSNCKDFTNKVFKADGMELAKNIDNGEESMSLAGHIEFTDEVGEGSMIEIEVAKETELGSEPMWSCTADLCASIRDEKAPWAAALTAMDITNCPIGAGKYYSENMTLNMDVMDEVLDEKYEGEYIVKLMITDDKMNVIACYHLGLAVTPVDK